MALAGLARKGRGHTMPIADIAREQGLPVDYLEQIFMKLRRAGLVVSARGPGGGYALARPASEIAIADILRAADEAMRMTRCRAEEEGGCAGPERCVTHDFWDALGAHIQAFLQGASLQDVADRKIKSARAAATAMERARA